MTEIPWFIYVVGGLSVVLIFIRMTSASQLQICLDDPIDSFEALSEAFGGRACRPYVYDVRHDDNRISATLRGHLEFDFPLPVFWHLSRKCASVELELLTEESLVPPGFTVGLKRAEKASSGTHNSLDFDIAPSIPFFVEILGHVKEIAPIRLEFSARLISGDLPFEFLARHPKTTFTYEFYVGAEELGDAWVGIDPGTTGGCVAGASADLDGPVMERLYEADRIIPSVINFGAHWEKGKAPAVPSELVARPPSSTYLIGDDAEQIIGAENTVFRSFKKFLGYKFTDSPQCAL